MHIYRFAGNTTSIWSNLLDSLVAKVTARSKRRHWARRKLLSAGWSRRARIHDAIDQGEEMAVLHPENVNTVRLAAYCVGDEQAVICSFVKMGQGDNVVDNGAAGGILAAVDEETGVVITPGRIEHAEVVEVHPGTGVRIKGFQIPDWAGLRALVDQLVTVLPEQKHVGWDLAYSGTKGWVLVEGNSGGQFVGPQISKCKGVGHLVEKTFGRL